MAAGGVVEVGVLAVRHGPASAALVRRAIAADLAGRHVPADAAEDVVLVASELVGNAVVHAGAGRSDDLAVTWQVAPEAVTVEVGDPSPELPRMRTWSDTTAGGRGLHIVAAIADSWGVQPTAHGKKVWARVPVSRSA
jgi:anti-sigma regulatory factor (Ser/Thr protein kinase)